MLNIFFLLQAVYALLGETLSKMQQYAEAEKWFRACLNQEPNYTMAHITYAELLAKNVNNIQKILLKFHSKN